jgi:RimJ/RimL family protein N-acetyltransferase
MSSIVPAVVDKGTMTAIEQPTLTAGDTLRLRPWRSDDRPAVVTAYADPDIQRWHLQALDETEAGDWIENWKLLWQKETHACWAITDAASDTVLGRVALREIRLADGHGEMAYWVLPAARGRGAAPAAVEAITRWAFADLGLHRLELRHSVDNTGSCRVAAKSGFALEGVLRDHLRHTDGWHDGHLHARIDT